MTDREKTDCEGQTVYMIWRVAGSIWSLIDVVSSREKAGRVDYSQHPLYCGGDRYMIEKRKVK